MAIQSTRAAFAALRSDGTVVSWGNPSFGGTAYKGGPFVKAQQVKAIQSSEAAFMALHYDGSVTAWGNANCGGAARGLEIVALQATGNDSLGAVATLDAEGTVETWGSNSCGCGMSLQGIAAIQASASVLSLSL